MTEARRCVVCGLELSAEASPQGLCARCLLEAGLKESQATSDSRQATSPGAPHLEGSDMEGLEPPSGSALSSEDFGDGSLRPVQELRPERPAGR